MKRKLQIKKSFSAPALFVVAAFLFAVWGANKYLKLNLSHKLLNKSLWPVEFMPLEEVCRRYGDQALDEEKFRMAGDNEPIRSKMACSLLKNQKKYVGKDILEIREIFGDWTGHFFNESFPAYLIDSAEKHGKNSWQLLFLLNHKEKISKIVVHKNCCYR